VLRRRRRPVDLQLARRRDRQHPALRERFPGALIVRLEENYRSTPEILAAAAGIIAHNRGRLGKTLWTRAGEGERANVRGLWDAEQGGALGR
jgi:superfamily I DNA/RNA helicase